MWRKWTIPSKHAPTALVCTAVVYLGMSISSLKQEIQDLREDLKGYPPMANVVLTYGNTAHNSERIVTYTSGADSITVKSYANSAVESAAQRRARVLAHVTEAFDEYAP